MRQASSVGDVAKIDNMVGSGGEGGVGAVDTGTSHVSGARTAVAHEVAMAAARETSRTWAADALSVPEAGVVSSVVVVKVVCAASALVGTSEVRRTSWVTATAALTMTPVRAMAA